MPADGDLLEIHDVIDHIERELKALSDRYFPVIQVDHSYVEGQKTP